MSKVICDICGTQYSDSAECCPICGCTRGYDSDVLSDVDEALFMEEIMGSSVSSGKKKREVFDFDEVNMDDEEPMEEEDYDEEDTFEDETGSNTAVVVILVILIALLLLAVGFLFFRFFLPNLTGAEETTAPVETIMAVVTEPEETTEPTIPCTDLSIPGGKVELSQQGQMWLMNVQVFPQNTTDILTFASDDESVAVVDEGGRVTAVGEGQTVIHILCGNMQMDCPVTVNFGLETEPTETVSVPAVTVGEETVPAQTEAEAPATAENTLKVKKNDITIAGRYYYWEIELDCDIPMEDIKWISMNSAIALVKNGQIHAMGPGTTTVIGTYGDQKVEIIVRCNFS